jgi:kynurenine formamidase
LIEQRKVRALGTDAPAIDASGELATAPAQTLAAKSGVFCVAGLGDLRALPRDGAYLVLGVLPVVGGTGAPCRALALVPPAPPPSEGARRR